VTPVLQDYRRFRFNHAGTESHEIALNEGHKIAFTVGCGNIFCVGARWRLDHFTGGVIGSNFLPLQIGVIVGY
jgi:hypothetical protein